jgi:hypothetical protein
VSYKTTAIPPCDHGHYALGGLHFTVAYSEGIVPMLNNHYISTQHLSNLNSLTRLHCIIFCICIGLALCLLCPPYLQDCPSPSGWCPNLPFVQRRKLEMSFTTIAASLTNQMLMTISFIILTAVLFSGRKSLTPLFLTKTTWFLTLCIPKTSMASA